MQQREHHSPARGHVRIAPPWPCRANLFVRPLVPSRSIRSARPGRSSVRGRVAKPVERSLVVAGRRERASTSASRSRAVDRAPASSVAVAPSAGATRAGRGVADYSLNCCPGVAPSGNARGRRVALSSLERGDGVAAARERRPRRRARVAEAPGERRRRRRRARPALPRIARCRLARYATRSSLNRSRSAGVRAAISAGEIASSRVEGVREVAEGDRGLRHLWSWRRSTGGATGGDGCCVGLRGAGPGRRRDGAARPVSDTRRRRRRPRGRRRSQPRRPTARRGGGAALRRTPPTLGAGGGPGSGIPGATAVAEPGVGAREAATVQARRAAPQRRVSPASGGAGSSGRRWIGTATGALPIAGTVLRQGSAPRAATGGVGSQG